MAKPLAVGDRVEGKSKKLVGRHGVVLAVSTASRMRSYTVQWDSGASETVSARSICREAEVAAWARPDIAQPARQEERSDDIDMFDSSSDMSISSSSSDEGVESTACGAHAGIDEGLSLAGAAVADDGGVYAHGRKWIHCDAVLVDPAIFAPARKAALHWPPHLQLGERSFASYFYLMYPMDSLQTTILETNKLLVERRQGTIGRGELFRWIGIRLAMTLEPRRGPLAVFWESSVPDGYVGTAANYGKLMRALRNDIPHFSEHSECTSIFYKPTAG